MTHLNTLNKENPTSRVCHTLSVGKDNDTANLPGNPQRDILEDNSSLTGHGSCDSCNLLPCLLPYRVSGQNEPEAPRILPQGQVLSNASKLRQPVRRIDQKVTIS